MSWAGIAIGLVLWGVAYLLTTMRGIDQAKDESRYYALSVRFWAGLAVLGVMLAISFAHPVYRFFDVGRVAWLTTGLLSVPFGVVVFAGLRNALALHRAHQRRVEILGRGTTVRGRVVERSRRAFLDIMAVVVEADLPRTEPSVELAYRPRDQERTIRHRFVECCPTDHWARFEPGRSVELEVDVDEPTRYAVHLFAAR